MSIKLQMTKKDNYTDKGTEDKHEFDIKIHIPTLELLLIKKEYELFRDLHILTQI